MSSTLDYACQKYVLTYGLHDKSISIVHVDDVIGWTQEEFEKLKICKRVELMVNNDDSLNKVLVLQCASSYEGLKETLKFVFEMKRKKQTISFIQTHFNPVRGLNRQRLPPVYPLHTASEGSNFDTDHSDSIAPYSQNTAAEAVVLMPLPPLKIKKFLGAHKAPHNQDTAAEAVVLKPLPPLKSQKFPATHKVPSVQLHLSTQPIVSNVSQTDIQSISSPHDFSDTSLLRMNDSMLGVCSRLNIEPFSAQGQFLMNAYILRELTSIQSKLNNLEQRQGRLEARVCSVSIDQNSSNTQFPVFTSLLQYSEVAKHPKDMLSWMKLEEGLTANEHISRVLNKLLALELQQNINRTGSNGKHKFLDNLENLVKTSTILFFPGTTTKEIELKVARFFNNARDRCGGRLQRGLKKRDVLIEQDIDCASNEGSEVDSYNDPQPKKRKTFLNKY
ncbi:uncharacterized protein LOC136075241 isoform X2 [Hydra vulgaris]|uniref:Uncharacterized protein LOC136075241 isoform X2 n=1 Tax=Hydra vulgaris TaxID=6087 RepID=A0ABM4B4X0_HYDVU